MEKTEVLVDTVFLQNLSAQGKNVEGFKKVISELGFVPVVHSYLVDCEWDMYPQFQQLIAEGYIRKINYSEYLTDETDRKFYETYFMQVHEELRKDLEGKGGRKKLARLQIPSGFTVFNFRKSNMSLGDVHMILLASFMKMPVILSDDGDLDSLKHIAETKFSYSNFSIQILDCVEVLRQIASKET